MNPMIITLFVALVIGVIGLLAGVGLGYMLKQRSDEEKLETAQKQADVIKAAAEDKAQKIVQEAKEEAVATRIEADAEANRRRHVALSRQHHSLAQITHGPGDNGGSLCAIGRGWFCRCSQANAAAIFRWGPKQPRLLAASV